MKTILFIGDLNKYGRSYRRLKTIKQLNYKIISFSHTKVSKDKEILKPSLIFRIFNKLMIPLDLIKINKRILSTVNQKQIDILWIENGVLIYPKTIRKIKKNNPKIKIIALSEDDMCKRHNQSIWYILGIRYYDMVFTTKRHNISCLKKMGVKKIYIFKDNFDHTLHKIYKKALNFRSNIQVSAIGAFEKERAEDLYFIAKNGIKVNVWGNGWNAFKQKHPNLLIHNAFLFGKDYSQTIFKSKININFLRKVNEDVITSRTLEIPASGGFMLAERTVAQKKIFKEGIEADYFSSKEELFKKVKFYLSNPKKRNFIRKKGIEKCSIGEYTMINQLNIILNQISKLGK